MVYGQPRGKSTEIQQRENFDVSKGMVGAHFLVEPRFLPNLNITRKTGIEIPPAGAYGLE